MKKKWKVVSQYRIMEQYDRKLEEPTYYTVHRLYIDKKGNAEWRVLGSYKVASGIDPYFVEDCFVTIELAKKNIDKRIIQDR
ncbi:hypothetical protein LCGC14_2118410, partial [marine sediment metagenome]